MTNTSFHRSRSIKYSHKTICVGWDNWPAWGYEENKGIDKEIYKQSFKLLVVKLDSGLDEECVRTVMLI